MDIDSREHKRRKARQDHAELHRRHGMLHRDLLPSKPSIEVSASLDAVVATAAVDAQITADLDGSPSPTLVPAPTIWPASSSDATLPTAPPDVALPSPTFSNDPSIPAVPTEPDIPNPTASVDPSVDWSGSQPALPAVPTVPPVPPFPTLTIPSVPTVPTVPPVPEVTLPSVPAVPSVPPQDSATVPHPPSIAPSADGNTGVLGTTTSQEQLSSPPSTPQASDVAMTLPPTTIPSSTAVPSSLSNELTSSTAPTSISNPPLSLPTANLPASVAGNSTFTGTSTNGFGGATGTGTGSAPSSSSTSNNGSSSSNTPPTPVVVGGVLGGVAGLALILAIILVFLRWRKKRNRAITELPSSAGDPAISSQPEPGREMFENTTPHSSTGPRPLLMTAFMRNLRGSGVGTIRPVSADTPPTTAGTPEPSFTKLAGRKLPQGNIGDGYDYSTTSFNKELGKETGPSDSPISPESRPTTPFPSGHASSAFAAAPATQMARSSSNYGSEHGDYDSAPRSSATGLGPGAIMAGPRSGLRDSPARSSLSRQIARPRPGSAMADSVGRSHASMDGSRSSRFTEDMR
ncbi:MAG: hypothetical protein M1824_005185 [Vezdaea acicularis]|nr:MAG: hypothetical protein M1824_005185 [Vezdaea acicularis]